jgi:hypothetical protein
VAQRLTAFHSSAGVSSGMIDKTVIAKLVVVNSSRMKTDARSEATGSVAGYCGEYKPLTRQQISRLQTINWVLSSNAFPEGRNRLPIESQRDSGSVMVHCRSFSKMIPQYLSGLRSREMANVQGFAISMDSNSLLREDPRPPSLGSAVPLRDCSNRSATIAHSLVKASKASGDRYRQPDLPSDHSRTHGSPVSFPPRP